MHLKETMRFWVAIYPRQRADVCSIPFSLKNDQTHVTSPRMWFDCWKTEEFLSFFYKSISRMIGCDTSQVAGNCQRLVVRRLCKQVANTTMLTPRGQDQTTWSSQKRLMSLRYCISSRAGSMAEEVKKLLLQFLRTSFRVSKKSNYYCGCTLVPLLLSRAE